MATPAIPHFGTTLYEVAPAPDADQASLPFEGMLARTHRFLTVLGAEIAIKNFYGPAVGRQYIYRRGKIGDLDYFEKDSFTSYTAKFTPPSSTPRVADTYFRVVHTDIRAVYQQLLREDLIRPIGPEGDADRFLSGEHKSVLVLGPDEQRYELAEVSNDPAENHAIFMWTDPALLSETVRDYAGQFDIVSKYPMQFDFHGIGNVTVLTRAQPPVTIGLITPYEGQSLAPRWTDDVFGQVGYSHFRLGSPRKAVVREHNREVFPDTGDVSYVMFHEAYLELVQLEDAAVPA
jgi:hypothetical protein